MPRLAGEALATLGWLLLGLVVISAVVGYRVRAPRRRWAALTAFAAERGWQPQQHDPSLVSRWSQHPFGRGEDRQARDVLTGAYRGRSILAFRYSYEEPSGDSEGHPTTKTRRFAVCSVRLPAPLPDLSVDPTTFMYRVARGVGFPALRFADEEFDHAFAVHAADPKFAYDWDDGRYHFASAMHREMFAKDPERYAPQFGGYCTGSMSRGVRNEGDPEGWTIKDGKLYVFGGFGLVSFVLAGLAFVLMIYYKTFAIPRRTFIQTPLPMVVVMFVLVGCLSMLLGLVAELTVRTYYESQGKRTYSLMSTGDRKS
jgi:YHS domain-containing protein